MNRLLLTCIMVAGVGSLHGMEVQQKQVSPIMPQVYNYFAKNMDADVAREIFLLQLQTSGVGLAKNPRKFVQFIKTLLNSCGYDLTIIIVKQFFDHTKLSICDIEDISNTFSHTPLCYAIQHSYLTIAQMLLKIAGDKVWELLMAQDIYGYAALHDATHPRDIDKLKLLLNAASDNAWAPLTRQTTSGKTALHLAAFFDDNIESVKLLLDAAGDKAEELLTMQNIYGQTALDRANPITKEVMQKYMTINK